MMMTDMKIETYAEPQEQANAFVTLRRAALVALCAVLVAVLGIGVPYKTYKYFKAKQDAAAASVPHEEL
jgi:hypothetical protein